MGYLLFHAIQSNDPVAFSVIASYTDLIGVGSEYYSQPRPYESDENHFNEAEFKDNPVSRAIECGSGIDKEEVIRLALDSKKWIIASKLMQTEKGKKVVQSSKRQVIDR